MKLFRIMETSFDNFDTTVRQYLTKVFNTLGKQYSHSQIFGAIYDGIKGVMQNMMFYIEDSLNEQNVYTASRKQSVYSLAKSSGYDPYYGSAATGQLVGKVHVTNTIGKDNKIFIKHGCRIRNTKTNLMYSIYLTTNNYVFDISRPLVNHQFSIVQGFFYKSQYVSKGEILETIHISSLELYDRNYLKVRVNGKEWFEVGNLYDMTENGEQYVITTGYDNTFDVMFGNGVHGKILQEGQVVEIEYLKHAGASGNILPNEYSEWKFYDYGYDTLGNEVNINDFMKLELSTCISGGTQSDTIGFIRKMIGYNSRSLVIASEDNFKLFFKRFSFIGYLNCWSEQNSMSVIVTCLRNISNELSSIDDYFNMNVNNMLLDNRQKSMIQNTLENSKKSFAGITLKFKDPIIRQYAVIAYVKVDNVYNNDIAKYGIKKSLAEFFMNSIENTTFIPKSQLIKKIHDDNDCIISVDLDIISAADQQGKYTGEYQTYELQLVNGVYEYILVNASYDQSESIGLDEFGNIKLSSKLEIPILHGGFKYYIPESNGALSSYNIEAVQVYFIN